MSKIVDEVLTRIYTDEEIHNLLVKDMLGREKRSGDCGAKVAFRTVQGAMVASVTIYPKAMPAPPPSSEEKKDQ